MTRPRSASSETTRADGWLRPAGGSAVGGRPLLGSSDEFLRGAPWMVIAGLCANDVRTRSTYSMRLDARCRLLRTAEGSVVAVVGRRLLILGGGRFVGR